MNNLKSTKLIEALKIIASIIDHQIIKIEFEDGSGNKFNYDTTDEHNKFIDLSKHLEFQLAIKNL